MNGSDETFWLGYCFEYGIGVEKDNNKAFTHYQKSADMDNPNGIYQVGHCYYLGIGVEMDKHKAFIHYQKSAEAGNFKGIFKTAICYRYGVGVKEDYKKFKYLLQRNDLGLDLRHYSYFHAPDRYLDSYRDRDLKYGKCAHCDEYNTYNAWCQTCDPDITIQRWTSGNKEIDNCIKEFQLKTNAYECIIEWIPFNRLNIIEIIGKGGFGSVFSATWLDGIRKIDSENGNCIRVREPSSIVALKTLSNSEENILDVLKEFSNHMRCRMSGSKLEIYGLTQNVETNEYFMVFQHADNGSLYKFLRKNFQCLTWQFKLKLLLDISNDLVKIHSAGFIHADFHSGNILQDQRISNSMHSYISDLGLSKKEDENTINGDIYGVIPYVAPEILLGQQFTKAADIYGFGVIMAEMSTGQRPFDEYEFNTNFAVKICNGLRPEFAFGTPNCYIELARQCMDSDPHKRPEAWNIWDKLYEWIKIMEGYRSMEGLDEDKIKKQFLDADEIIKKLPIVSNKNPDSMYTSKIIRTQVISNAIKV